MELNYSSKFQLLKGMLSQEITLQRNPNSASAAAILKQVLSGQAAKRDVSPPILNLAESLNCSWLSNMLSGFSCLACVKMP